MVFAFALIAAACGDDDDTAGGGASAAGNIADYDFSGMDITVSSKNFTEQLVLGEILVQALEAAGATIDNQTNLGGTVVNREALLAGEVDMYWEYNGTGWTVHLAQEDPSFDSAQLTENVRAKDLADNNIRWVGRSPFNDTYGFAANADVASGAGGSFTLQEMADYLAVNPDATVCLESEFPNRPDGLVLWETATGYDLPESQVVNLELGVIYTEIEAGNCDFGEVFTTDGRIASLGLSLVEDPGVFIIYNVSLTMGDEIYQENPEEWDRLTDALLAELDEERMTELNRRVSEGEDASAVAADYLNSIGMVLAG
ncbi:MAG: glycine betaine ABC transporter substrate-binding protein [Acidimicrobiia bacterium]